MGHILESLKPSYDAIVVGARCAGAATALLLARAGLDVLALEQGARGTDTLSTLALMRAGVLQLSRWGLLDDLKALGAPAVTKTTFFYGDEAVPIRIKPRDGVDALYAPRRTVLDPLLADAARAAGANVSYRTRLRGLVRDSTGRVTGVQVEAEGIQRTIGTPIVIGADGIHSAVARAVGAVPFRSGAHTSAVIYTLARGVPIDGYQWHYAAAGSGVGIIPTNAGETMIFAAAPRERFMRDFRWDLAAGFDAMVGEMSSAAVDAVAAADRGTYRAFAGHPGFFRPAWGSGWALVGDAGYFKDPITAHGITDALRDAELLARAVTTGTDAALAAYQTIRDELSATLFSVSDEIASFAWDMPRLQALHRVLSEEMTKETVHVSRLGNALQAV